MHVVQYCIHIHKINIKNAKAIVMYDLCINGPNIYAARQLQIFM